MRHTVVAVTLAAFLVSGCAREQPWLRPGDDPNELAEAIAQTGRGEGPMEPGVQGGSFLLADSLNLGYKVAQVCVFLPLFFLYCCAPGPKDRGSATFPALRDGP